MGAFGGDQTGKLVAAGHQHQAPRGARQQRAHVVGVTGVVQHDQHPFPSEQAAVEGALGLQSDRDPLWGHSEGVQHPPDRIGRFHHRPSRVEPP